MMLRFVVAAGGMAISIGCSTTAPPASTAPPEPSAPALASLSAADLDRYIAAVVEANHAVGVNVGVMKNGEVVLAKGYGLANVE